jgi:hypothetical protein
MSMSERIVSQPLPDFVGGVGGIVVAEPAKRAGTNRDRRRHDLSPPPDVPRAVVGLLVLTGRASVRGISFTARTIAPLARAIIPRSLVRGPLENLRGRLSQLDRLGADQIRRWEEALRRLADDLVPAVARELLDRLDLDEIVDRVDLNEIAGEIDVNMIAAQVDVEAIVAKVDLTKLAQQVIDSLDLAGIARGVINELELSEIIRESTGTVTVEAVDALRLGGMSADRVVSRVMDRLLLRKTGRNHAAASPNGDGGR